jgi:hypothetical protein
MRMQHLATLTTIGTVTAMTCLSPIAAQAATPVPDAPPPATLDIPAPASLATSSTIVPPESTALIESMPPAATTITQVPVDNFPTTLPPAWTIETSPVQSLPTQTGSVPAITATQPVWTESAAVTNADVARTELPLNSETVPTTQIPNNFANGEVTAQLPAEAEAAALQQEIQSYEPAPMRWVKRYKASPGITMAVPSGFGADRGKAFFGVGVQRTRINSNDGSAGIGFGLGDARKSVGVQISYTSASISPSKLFPGLGRIPASNRPFGAGGFNIKIHRQFPGALSVAVGADSIINIGPRTVGISGASNDGTSQNESEGTYYAAATKLFQLKPDATDSFSRLAVTIGAGTGRFQPTQTLIDGKKIITPFASVALKVSPAASVIAEWTGQDFGVGLSWVPFRNLPFVISPGIRDIFGPDATRPRFILGFGMSL